MVTFDYTIADFDGASDDNPRLRCEPTNIMFDWTFEADVNRITQTRDTIVIEYGQFNLKRTIHMNMKAHPKDGPRSSLGHSIGRFDGGTLVHISGVQVDVLRRAGQPVDVVSLGHELVDRSSQRRQVAALAVQPVDQV